MNACFLGRTLYGLALILVCLPRLSAANCHAKGISNSAKLQDIPKLALKNPFPYPNLCTEMFYDAPAPTSTISKRQVNTRVAILVRGESFRSGGRAERKICETQASYEWQRAAANTHMVNVVRPLEKAGLMVDIYLATYSCPTKQNTAWMADLISWYQPNLKAHNFIQRTTLQQTDQGTLINKVLGMLASHSNSTCTSYGAGVLLLRADFFVLRDYTSLSSFPMLGKKLLYIIWGGYDLFFAVPWYLMNCFGGVYRSTCFRNAAGWGAPCMHALRANFVDEVAQIDLAFERNPTEVGCWNQQPCPPNSSWILRPQSNPIRERMQFTCSKIKQFLTRYPRDCG